MPFTLVKPTVTGYDNSSVSAGGALTIQGTDLDLVKTVQFGEESDIVYVENATAEAIALTVPMNALTGAPVLTLANGTTVADVPQVSIEEAVFCYATELPGDDAELKAGESLTLTIANGDKLTGVQIGGTDCQYVLVNSNTQLIIGIPDNAGPGSKVRLISSNGEMTYTIDFIPNTEVTTVLWTGALDLNGWSINWQIGDGTAGADNPRMFADMDLQEGDIIRVYATNYNDWWQVQFFDGHWGEQKEIGNATGLNNGNNINSGIYSLADHGGCIEIPVTATLKEQLTTLCDWGYCWIVQGEGVVITKIAVTHYVSLETTVWTGEAVADRAARRRHEGGLGHPSLYHRHRRSLELPDCRRTLEPQHRLRRLRLQLRQLGPGSPQRSTGVHRHTVHLRPHHHRGRLGRLVPAQRRQRHLHESYHRINKCNDNETEQNHQYAVCGSCGAHRHSLQRHRRAIQHTRRGCPAARLHHAHRGEAHLLRRDHH